MLKPIAETRKTPTQDRHRKCALHCLIGSAEWSIPPTGWVLICQSAFNGDPLSSSNCDPPPGGGTGGETPPPAQPAATIHPNPFYADHPWLPFLRCPMRRNCYSQRAGSNSDANSLLHGSSLHAFQHSPLSSELKSKFTAKYVINQNVARQVHSST